MSKTIILIALISLFLVGCTENSIINKAAEQIPDSSMGEYKPVNKTGGLEGLQDTSAKARDAKRLTDIQSLQTALEFYKTDQGNYPVSLDELVDQGMVNAIPTNPTPGGIDYSYTPIGSLPAQYYDLCYELEEGTAEVAAGYHCVSP